MKKFLFALSSMFILPHIIFYLLIDHNSGGNKDGYKSMAAYKR